MHYYQFNIGDYVSHASRLSPIEDLAYRRMIDLYYLNEQPLSLCLSDVAREIGLTEYLDEVTYVLNKFFIETELGFTQKRIDLEIKKYKSNHKSKIKAGKASAKARQAKASSGDSPVQQVLNTPITNVELNIKHKPLTNNQEPLTNNQLKEKDSTAINRFNEFWSMYNKKVDRVKCEKKFAKLNQSEVIDIFFVLPQYIQSTPDPKYRKNPLTWLNGNCWKDEVQKTNGLSSAGMATQNAAMEWISEAYENE